MPSSFEVAIDTVIHHEAYQRPDKSWLYWVNNPNDSGGETAWGISTLIILRENISAEDLGVDPLRLSRHLATFKAKLAKQPLPIPEPEGVLKGMPIGAAKNIYKRLFWDRFAYWNVSNQTVATKIFDFAVNASPRQAGLEAQRAGNLCGLSLKEDGQLGDRSFQGINSLPPAQFLVAMSTRMTGYYDLIISHHPQYEEFRKNWHRRAAWVG